MQSENTVDNKKLC